MRFPCLVLDHDDTVVNSTAVIHFPSFQAYLAKVRPGVTYTLEEYFRKNFDPGILPLFRDVLGFSDEELEGEFRFWQDWVAERVPQAYPGMREILERMLDSDVLLFSYPLYCYGMPAMLKNLVDRTLPLSSMAMA